MAPIIKVGEIVSPEPINNINELRPFTIIVFWSQDKYLCHFYWKTVHINQKTYLLTKSLKHPAEFDTPVSFKNVVGIITTKKISWYHKLVVYLKCIIKW